MDKDLAYQQREIDFYRENIQRLHHLRLILEFEPGDDPTRFLYTEIAPLGAGRPTLLIQGDSWGEMLLNAKPARARVREFAERHGLGAVGGGVDSYSPSPMAVQLDVLAENHGVRSDYVLAMIDQTDMGDEACRYADRVERDAGGKPVAVRPEPFESDELYAFGHFFERQRVLRADGSRLLAHVRASLATVRHEMAKQQRRCGWRRIAKPLADGPSPAEEEVFMAALNDYFEAVFADGRARLLHIVVHPHEKHLAPARYKGEVGRLVRKAMAASPHGEKMILQDFGAAFETTYAGLTRKEIFKADDPASHLNDAVYDAVFIPAVLERLGRALGRR